MANKGSNVQPKDTRKPQKLTELSEHNGIDKAVSSFLKKQPQFNIGKTSIYDALRRDSTVSAAPAEIQPKIVEHLKTLHRVHAISPKSEAVPKLIQRGLTSAYQIARQSQSDFVATHGRALGKKVARQVHANAVDATIANEQALMAMHEAVNGTGIRAIDGKTTKDQRAASVQRLLNQHAAPFDLSALIGGIDLCSCDDCNSVFGFAAYLVELLEFLRSNNLGTAPPGTNPKGITGTALEQLLRRRPDIACLELTCPNSMTMLPWIDLANEVMESFVVHLTDYEADPNVPKQAKIEAYNIEDGPSEQLLAQAENTNYRAYCRLKNAPYPFSLPYHQPIDDIRILLDFMKTSREDLLRCFATAKEDVSALGLSAADEATVQALHAEARKRAQEAEALGMTQEEYIILTGEAFWTKDYFDLTSPPPTPSMAAYQTKIGLRPKHEYYGYTTQPALLSTNSTTKTGLTWVSQFLRRTGITYSDLIALLKTRTINPSYPQGRALEIMESLHESYRFMQALVDTSATTPNKRFAKLIQQLQMAKTQWPKLDALLHPDPCHQRPSVQPLTNREIAQWVACWFDRIGRLIVIETGDGPTLSVAGDIYRPPVRGKLSAKLGILRPDGTVTDANGKVVGRVQPDGLVLADNGKTLPELFGTSQLLVVDPATKRTVGTIIGRELRGADRQPVVWAAPQDSCDNSKARLLHLDGSALSLDEYDRLHRFIRLKNRLGWSADELDKALVGQASPANNGPITMPVTAGGSQTSASTLQPNVESPATYGIFQDDCSAAPGALAQRDTGNQPQRLTCPADFKAAKVTPALIEQFAAIKKLQSETSVDLVSLLAFWSDISTDGDTSLYARLFLQFNVSQLDPVFKSDTNGNYLAQNATISDHLPALMAALHLTSAGIAAIMALRQVADKLTLANLSIIYRHGMLARILGIQATELPRVLELFGDPFTDAVTTLQFVRLWKKMRDSGFACRALDYVVDDYDDPSRPLGPSVASVILFCKTLRDGLRAIASANPDPGINAKAHPELLTDDAIRAVTALLYDQPTVDKIVQLLSGQAVNTVGAPVLNPAPVISGSLVGRLIYATSIDGTSATLQMVGILSPAEVNTASTLSTDPAWAPAVAALDAAARSESLFDEVLNPIFDNVATAKAKLLARDVIAPASPVTAPGKRYYFLNAFMPFLRRRLGQQLIVDAISSNVGLDADVTQILLRDIIKSGPQTALDMLLNIAEPDNPPPDPWTGYLIAPATDDFTFVVGDNASILKLDGQDIALSQALGAKWASNPISLKSGRAYSLSLTAKLMGQLTWKRATTALAPPPASALIPDSAIKTATTVLEAMRKAALLVTGFNLKGDEVSYLQSNGTDFDNFDFNAVTLAAWKRLLAYGTLRDSLPAAATPLINLFKTCHAMPAPPLAPSDLDSLVQAIAASMGWDVTSIRSLIASAHFDLEDPAEFTNEQALVKLQDAMVISEKTRMDVARLFEWADPTSQFWPCRAIAQVVRRTLQSRYTPSEWDSKVKPLNDKLRTNQQAALNAYLLAQDPIAAWGATDANSLLEFFLIDTQMSTCMQSTRIRQAIAAVQLFVWRCFQGFEPSVPVGALDRKRWKWMGEFAPWWNARSTFIYPETRLVSSLREDKSPFYRDLESALLQKDIDSDLIEGALSSYIYSVDGVSNLAIAGIYVETPSRQPTVVHIFARTRTLPAKVYYRRFDFTVLEWSPWERVQVEIPTYDAPDPNDATKPITGMYLCPIRWQDRLFIFFPEFSSKNTPDPTTGEKKLKDVGDQTTNATADGRYWEVKLAWSEYRSGQWTQKQVSNDHFLLGRYIWTNPAKPAQKIPWPTSNVFTNKTSLANVGKFLFVPRTGVTQIGIDVLFSNPENANDVVPVARFHFSGNELHVENWAESLPPTFELDWTFQRRPDSSNLILSSLQGPSTGTPPLALDDLTAASSDATTASSWLLNGEDQGGAYLYASPLIRDINKDVETLYDSFAQLTTGTGTTAARTRADNFGADYVTSTPVFNELRRPYSLYNWELGFHAPLAIAARLASARQWDDAFEIFHTVFDPGSKDSDPQRVWKFPPFKLTSPDANVEAKFLALQPNQYDGDIAAWRADPFNPHGVARRRPVAYMKWTVLQYVQMLIDRGDDYYRQYDYDTIQLALENYILALHVLGPRPQTIPKRGKVKPETYDSLLGKWDAFGNAMVEMELLFPFSNQTTATIAKSGSVVGLPNVFGFATSLYFCIPPNPKIAALRSLIEDRLFNIRHCRDINGNFRQLSLFGTLDASLQELADELGVSLESALDDLSTPTPNYRFNFLLQKAYAYVSETKALAATFLATQEKKDSESLAALRAAHETNIYELTLSVREQQLAEAQASLAALQQSRAGPVNRLQHYLRLINADISKVPAPDETYDLIADPIETPSVVSGLVLSDYEKEEMTKAADAAQAHEAVGHLQAIAGVLGLIPQFNIHLTPVGVGAATGFGGRQLSTFAQAAAHIAQIVSDERTFDASNAARKSGYLRQFQERVLQANSAGLEIMSIDKQIATQQIRIKIAEQEKENQTQQIENSKTVEDFLKAKYANVDLYDWMRTSLRSLHYQSYMLAYDMACRAQRVFNFERGLDKNFVTGGYWNDAKDGIFAADQLELALKAMEADYVHDRWHDLELARPPFSLKEIDPLALIELRETGSCQFRVTEHLLDREGPGTYYRRISSVALDLPHSAGPGVSVSGTLKLLSHRYRTTTSLNPSGYAEDTTTPGGDLRFRACNVPVDIIALCTGQNDRGVFEFTFNGERHLPLGGGGAEFTVQVDLQPDFRPCPYNFADLKLHLWYTAKIGDENFKKAAAAQVKTYASSQFDSTTRDGYFAAFELPRDFPDQWYRAAQINPPAARTFAIEGLADRLPHIARFFAGKKRPSNKLQAYAAYFIFDPKLKVVPNSAIFGKSGMSAGQPFGAPPSPIFTSDIGMTVLEADGQFSANEWCFTFDLSAAADPEASAWLVIRYALL